MDVRRKKFSFQPFRSPSELPFVTQWGHRKRYEGVRIKGIAPLQVPILAAMDSNDPYFQEALREARLGLAEGGIPIGSVLVHEGRIIGRGHNRRVQQGSAILHGEMDALENACLPAGMPDAKRPRPPSTS